MAHSKSWAELLAHGSLRSCFEFAIGHLLFAIGPAIRHQLSAIGHLPFAISIRYPLSAIRSSALTSRAAL